MHLSRNRNNEAVESVEERVQCKKIKKTRMNSWERVCNDYFNAYKIQDWQTRRLRDCHFQSNVRE